MPRFNHQILNPHFLQFLSDMFSSETCGNDVERGHALAVSNEGLHSHVDDFTLVQVINLDVAV